MLAAIFNDRLFDRLRAEQGASYGPVVNSHWPTGFDGGGYLLVGSLLAPQDIDRFYGIARDIAADLVATPREYRRTDTQRRANPRTGGARHDRKCLLDVPLEGATRDPRVTAAALSIQDDISAVTAADVQRLARQYLTPQRQWSLAVLPKGMTPAEASALGAAASIAVGWRALTPIWPI